MKLWRVDISTKPQPDISYSMPTTHTIYIPASNPDEAHARLFWLSRNWPNHVVKVDFMRTSLDLPHIREEQGK